MFRAKMSALITETGVDIDKHIETWINDRIIEIYEVLPKYHNFYLYDEFLTTDHPIITINVNYNIRYLYSKVDVVQNYLHYYMITKFFEHGYNTIKTPDGLIISI